MNYAELEQAVKDYTENFETSFVANIPTFVKQAERRLHRVVLIPEYRKNSMGSTTPGSPYLARPKDFISAFSMAVIDADGEYTFLYDKDMNFMREAYPHPGGAGMPKFYGQFVGESTYSPQGHFILGPTPDDAYPVELQYYYDPPSIVDEGTSWLGDNADNALLYGTLIEAYIFMKGDQDMMNQYQQRYQTALEQLGIIDVRGKRDSYRDGDMRVE